MNIGLHLEQVRLQQPLVHHITNWVTIYDCAQIVKAFGASPVMAHAREEAAEMTREHAGALVLNIGTLTADVIESMLLAGRAANDKGVPVVLDACGTGATRYRNRETMRLLDKLKINILKGNASEIAFVAGQKVKTKGVDAGAVAGDPAATAAGLAHERACTVVITGKQDVAAGPDGRVYRVDNGHALMTRVVGTGCMAASVIGTFAAVGENGAEAAAAGLACYGIAAELAAAKAKAPGTFKTLLFDRVSDLTPRRADKLARITS
ncbi:MAG: hydroxyethylthiazole kinase [Spirochaetales bacterium]|nr:hydroxyethylthiazole kinase [Spirochaetales bacterium]